MSKMWIISDVHFGHLNICRYRPQFSSMEEHDETVFENILTTVRKRDTLWMLGDSCFDEASYQKIVSISKAVLHLNYIPGNHDTDSGPRQEMYKRMIKDGLFSKTGSMFKHKGFWLTHPPIHPIELRGKPNIHGHTHNAFMGEGYVNVCVEHTNFKPIAFEEIRARFSYENSI